MPLAGILTTLEKSRCVEIIDLSCTGVKVRGMSLPAKGEELDIRIETVRAFGTVAWSRGNQCGVAFDEPLMPFEVERLRSQATAGNLTHLNLDERRAVDDWLLCVSR